MVWCTGAWANENIKVYSSSQHVKSVPVSMLPCREFRLQHHCSNVRHGAPVAMESGERVDSWTFLCNVKVIS